MQPLFNTIAVEIGALCNRSCQFCPVSTHKRDDDRMDPRILHACANELGAIGYAGRVEFYIYNEPLKHKEWLAEAVALFRAKAPRATLMISTNGDYLKGPDELEGLFRSGIQQIVLNGYVKRRYEVLREWAEDVRKRLNITSENVYSKIPSGVRALKVYDKSNPEESFGDGVFALQNRAGLIPGFLPPTKEPVERMCVKPFRMLNINWRGEAIICCNDFYADVPAGRVLESSLVDIWNGPVFTAYRKHLKQKNRSLPLCRVCDCHSGAYAGNVKVDDDAPAASPERIEEIYTKRLAKRSPSA